MSVAFTWRVSATRDWKKQSAASRFSTSAVKRVLPRPVSAMRRATNRVVADTGTVSGGLSAYLDARRADIEAALADVLPSPPDCPAAVAEAMRYSLRAGGKRLRPILCLAGADAVGGDRVRAMPAACAIELIHTYSLIHDDLPAMDNDTLRRGQPTLHVVVGEGMAILAGDGLLTEAFNLLAREPRGLAHPLIDRKIRVIGIVATAAGAMGMVGGQAIDLACVTPAPD